MLLLLMPSESTSKCHGNPLPTFCADGVPTIRAMATITFGDKQAVTMTTTMTEADFSGKLKGYEAHIVAAFLPKCQ